MANEAIRDRIKRYNLKHWEVAKCMGVHQCTLSNWLRVELDEEKKLRVEQAIMDLVFAKEEGA